MESKASNPFDEGSNRYYRIGCLLFKEGTEAMRKVFLKHVAADGLQRNQFHKFMKENEDDITRKLNRLNGTQSRKLFPSEGDADINEQDITLLFILISNLCDEKELGQEKEKVTKLKNFRNDYVHTEDFHINIDDFESEWIRLSDILTSLGVSTDTINLYKHKEINDAGRKNIADKIQQSKQDVSFQNLKADLSRYFNGERSKLLRFLLFDLLSDSDIMNSDFIGHDLFNALEEKGLITPTNVNLLLEITKLSEHRAADDLVIQYMKHTAGKTQLSRYRKQLFKALRNVGQADTRNVIAFYSLSKYKHVWDAIFHLETHGQLADDPDKIKMFADLLNSVSRRILLANGDS